MKSSCFAVVAISVVLVAKPACASATKDWLRLAAGPSDHRITPVWVANADDVIDDSKAGPFVVTNLTVLRRNEYEIVANFARGYRCDGQAQPQIPAYRALEVVQSNASQGMTRCILPIEQGCSYLSKLLSLNVGGRVDLMESPIRHLGQLMECKANIFGPFVATNIAMPAFKVTRTTALGRLVTVEVANTTQLRFSIGPSSFDASEFEIRLNGRIIMSRTPREGHLFASLPVDGWGVGPGEKLSHQVDLSKAFGEQELRLGQLCYIAYWWSGREKFNEQRVRICEGAAPEPIVGMSGTHEAD